MVDVRVGEKHRVDGTGFEPSKQRILRLVALLDPTIDEVRPVADVDLIAAASDLASAPARKYLYLRVGCLLATRFGCARIGINAGLR
jgi:hypothetical protein